MLVVVLALVGLALFLAPHRGRTAPPSKRTLAGAAADLLRHCRGGRLWRTLPLLAVAALGCLGVFLPAIVLAVARALSCPPPAWLFWLAAVVLLLATVSTWLVLCLSRITFGFGSSTSRDGTIFAPVILLWLAGAAVATGIAAVDDQFAAWLTRG
jgi:hypothetical protein